MPHASSQEHLHKAVQQLSIARLCSSQCNNNNKQDDDSPLLLHEAPRHDVTQTQRKSDLYAMSVKR